MSIESALPIVMAIVVLWFATRMMMGRKVRGNSLGDIFRREAKLPAIGLGQEAIRTLVDDTVELVRNERHLRGLILAGAFAAKAGGPDETVSFILISDAPDDYATRDFLGRWRYRARGHDISDYRAEKAGDIVIHHVRLRGAPKVAFHVVRHDTLLPEGPTRRLVETGARPIDTGTEAAKLALARWRGTPEAEETT